MQSNSNAAVRQDIADVLIEHALGAGEFIGLRAMPIFASEVKNGKFAKLAFSQVKTKVTADRAPGSNYNQVQHEVTSDTFDAQEYGLEEPVDDGEALVLGRYFDAEIAAAAFAQYYVMLKQEQRINSLLFDTATTFASYTSAVTTPWSTAATATPVADVEYAKEQIRRQIGGKMMNGTRFVGLLNSTTMRNLRNTSDIKDRVKYTQGGLRNQLSNQEIADALGIDELHDSAVQYNGSDIWSTSKFGLYLVSDNPAIRRAAHVGRSFQWTQDCPDNALVESYRDDSRRSEIVRVRQHVDEKILSARCGYVYTNIG